MADPSRPRPRDRDRDQQDQQGQQGQQGRPTDFVEEPLPVFPSHLQSYRHPPFPTMSKPTTPILRWGRFVEPSGDSCWYLGIYNGINGEPVLEQAGFGGKVEVWTRIVQLMRGFSCASYRRDVMVCGRVNEDRVSEYLSSSTSLLGDDSPVDTDLDLDNFETLPDFPDIM